jgi:hypothetical protein
MVAPASLPVLWFSWEQPIRQMTIPETTSGSGSHTDLRSSRQQLHRHHYGRQAAKSPLTPFIKGGKGGFSWCGLSGVHDTFLNATPYQAGRVLCSRAMRFTSFTASYRLRQFHLACHWTKPARGPALPMPWNSGAGVPAGDAVFMGTGDQADESSGDNVRVRNS